MIGSRKNTNVNAKIKRNTKLTPSSMRRKPSSRNHLLPRLMVPSDKIFTMLSAASKTHCLLTWVLSSSSMIISFNPCTGQ